jgi:hypothetical protein
MTVILPKATHEWNHLRIQDFKTVGEFSHAMNKISSKLIFCENEPSNAEKIEKTLSTMLPAHMILQQQYRQRGFTIYSELIKTLLQVERHDELLLWNSNQGPTGSKPLPEVHANTHNKKQKGAINNGNHETSNAKNKRKRQYRPHATKGKDNGAKGKDNSKSNKDKSKTCERCGCYNHPTKKCRTPKHLVELYLNSVGHGRSNQGRSNQDGQFEAHFNYQDDAPRCSTAAEPSNTKAPPLLDATTDDINNMILEYTYEDMFGDCAYAPCRFRLLFPYVHMM